MSADRPVPDGSYEGSLGPLPLILHVARHGSNLPMLTIDSPDQGAFGIECTEVTIDGRSLNFAVPSVSGAWSGALEADGLTLSGTWTQGGATALKWVRDTFVPAAMPSPIDGIWLGQLTVDKRSLRIQVTTRTDRHGRLSATLDSIDQRKTGLACANLSINGNAFSFDVPSVDGRWTGTLSADANRLTGRWAQRAEYPLDLERQTQPARVQPLPAPRMLPGLPPVPAAELGARLSCDFGDLLTTGWLSRGSAGGVVIGISQDGERSIVSFGAASDASIFEIGSVSKTFTGLLLAQMVAQGKAQLHEPVRALLPNGAVAKPAGEEITLLDLSTHHSGLPRLPANMQPADPEDPYADYDAQKLLAFVAAHGTGKAGQPGFSYSNLGAGLLGHALANRAGMPFIDLLDEQILRPLGMTDTAITLAPAQQARFIPGHAASGLPARPWNLNILAGAGGLRASAADLLTYLEAFCDPQSLRDAPGTSGHTLSAAFEDAQKPRVKVSDMLTMCLGWLYQPEDRTHWHTGGTGGYTSYAAFSRERRRAIVVLVNATAGDHGSPAEAIGRYVVERLEGRDAIWPGTALPEALKR
ncbi:serine hydrolase domain-containing protein [Paraburkholderia unamae]|uniref:Beta-lactamase n=1 Tax=Paraburkholderia unamae TaxID=219649 RepID=A0ABX5KPP6_9BURK|nr:serine hydrolase domain-containing protein [Paraburkholderia unamae]PVX84373.1 CubicO group peptidase (beta-lactamase class C family) [Paraburkholderia unamae]